MFCSPRTATEISSFCRSNTQHVTWQKVSIFCDVSLRNARWLKEPFKKQKILSKNMIRALEVRHNNIANSAKNKTDSWFQTFALFWIVYAFFWVISRRLNFICRRFGTLCLFHLHRQLSVDWLGWEMLRYLYGKRFGSKTFSSQTFPRINTSTFLNLVTLHLTAYEDETECSETSAYKIQTPGNYPEGSIQQHYGCVHFGLSRRHVLWTIFTNWLHITVNFKRGRGFEEGLITSIKLTATHPEGKRPLGSPRRRWECNRHVKTDLNYTGSDGVDWFRMIQYSVKWRALMNTVSDY